MNDIEKARERVGAALAAVEENSQELAEVFAKIDELTRRREKLFRENDRACFEYNEANKAYTNALLVSSGIRRKVAS